MSDRHPDRGSLRLLIRYAREGRLMGRDDPIIDKAERELNGISRAEVCRIPPRPKSGAGK